ncbi:MAG TPA: hypothetical protein VGM10_07590 [Actinocrinis sp.]|jgi:hypothetical protein
MDEDFRTEGEKEPTERRKPRNPGSSVELPELRIDVGENDSEDEDEVELRKARDAATLRYNQAKQDVDDPGYGRWVKYVIFTATEKANTVESSDFVAARTAMVVGALGTCGTAVSYLLPAINMSKIQGLDLAANATEVQQLTDQSNVEYYWGNASSLGFTSLGLVFGGLMGIRRAYTAMRLRILEQAAKERDEAQAKHDEHVKYVAKLEAAQKQNAALQKALLEAQAWVKDSAQGEKVALQKVVQLEQSLGRAALDIQARDNDLKKQQYVSDVQQREQNAKFDAFANEIQDENKGLKLELEKARQEAESTSQEAANQRNRAEKLQQQLQNTQHELEIQQLRVSTLEQERETSQLVIEVLQKAVVQITACEQKIDLANTQLTELNQKAQGVAKETKD